MTINLPDLALAALSFLAFFRLLVRIERGRNSQRAVVLPAALGSTVLVRVDPSPLAGRVA